MAGEEAPLSAALEACAPAWLAAAAVEDLDGSASITPNPADLEQLLIQGREAVVRGRYRRAYALFMEASQRAHEAGALATEARAQAQLAYSAASLGHNEEAIETAMLATQLARACPDDGILQVLVGNYLGVALLWNGSHEGAEASLAQTFEQAKALSRGRRRPSLFWQPMINRGFNEAYRLAGQRHLRRQSPDPRRLQTMLTALDAHAAKKSGSSAEPASLMLGGLLIWLRGFAAAWSGDAASARQHAAALQARCQQLADSPMLHVMSEWLGAELALATGQREGALLATRRMQVLSQSVEQFPLQRIALLLKADLHELSGRPAEALDSLRQLQLREQQLRQVSMHHRRNLAALRFELHQHKLEVQHLKSNAELLQRLSMEDALTGLANRRGLERRLAELLLLDDIQQEPLFVALIDVDQFKGINDRHSHQVGDQVLKALAGLFRQLLRGEDLAGRWGGDEFVLAFRAADEAQAQAVLERLRGAVQHYPWAALSEGLVVGISLGLSQAREGDTLDGLLLRSDLGMYAHKRRAR